MSEKLDINFDEYEQEELQRFVKRLKRRITRIQTQKVMYVRKIMEDQARCLGMTAQDVIDATRKHESLLIPDIYAKRKKLKEQAER